VATSAGEVSVTLTTDQTAFAAGLTGARTKLQEFSSAANNFVMSSGLATAVGFGGIVAAIKKSLDAYAQQTLATASLSQALANQGLAVSTNVERLGDFAAALQKSTGVSVTTITQAQALMTTFGLQGAQMDRTTKAAIDMSAALGIDLTTSAKLLGKAFDGNVGMLSRYGIIIDQSIPKSEQFNSILQQLETRFGGTATAQAQSYGGQIRILGSTFDELEKSIGKLLVTGGSGGLMGWLIAFLDKMHESLDVISGMMGRFKSLSDFLQTFAVSILGTLLLMMTQLLGKIADMMAAIPILGSRYTLLASAIKGTNTWLEEQIVKFQASKLAAADAAGLMIQKEYDKTTAVLQNVKQRFDAEKAMSDWQAENRMMDKAAFDATLAEKKSGYDKFAAAFTLTTDNMWLAAGQSAKQISDAFAKGMAEVIVKGKNFHDMMIQIWQDIEMQVIEYILKLIAKELILLALETVTGTVGSGGGGIAAAGSVFTGFHAQGGVIDEPSVITGMRTGNTSIAGEAGPEAIVPLSGGSGQGAGGSITININGQFIDGDSNSWNKLMREKIIPEIRRFTMSSPTGPFNRTRGVV
jgi:hypothetical protein